MRPILEELVKLGGRGYTKKILMEIKKIMLFNKEDKKLTKRSDGAKGVEVWRSRAYEAAKKMKKKGYLKKSSRRCTWELTKHGERMAESSMKYNISKKINEGDNIMRRKPDPIKHCQACGELLIRKRHRSGQLEDQRDFKRRSFCNNCPGQFKIKNKTRGLTKIKNRNEGIIEASKIISSKCGPEMANEILIYFLSKDII